MAFLDLWRACRREWQVWCECGDGTVLATGCATGGMCGGIVRQLRAAWLGTWREAGVGRCWTGRRRGPEAQTVGCAERAAERRAKSGSADLTGMRGCSKVRIPAARKAGEHFGGVEAAES